MHLFWLCWVFIAVSFFSPRVAASEGFSLQLLLLLQGMGYVARSLQHLWCVSSVVVVPGLQSTGSVVVAHGLSHSTACGVFPDQGLQPHLLHWQVESLLLSRQGSPFCVSLLETRPWILITVGPWTVFTSCVWLPNPDFKGQMCFTLRGEVLASEKVKSAVERGGIWPVALALKDQPRFSRL